MFLIKLFQAVSTDNGIMVTDESPDGCFPFQTHVPSKKKTPPVYFNSETHQVLVFPSKLLLGCLAASKGPSNRLFSK